LGFEDPVQTNYFNGQLDAVRIWTIERSAADLADNMAFDTLGPRSGLVASYALNGDALDSSGAHPGTLVGGPLFAPAASALALVLGRGTISCGHPAPSSPSELTIEAWVYAIYAQTGRILSIGDGNDVFSVRTLDLSYVNQHFAVDLFTGPVGT